MSGISLDQVFGNALNPVSIDEAVDLQRLGGFGGGVLGSASVWTLNALADVAGNGFELDVTGAAPEDVLVSDTNAALCTTTALTAFYLNEAIKLLANATNKQARVVYDTAAGAYAIILPPAVVTSLMTVAAPSAGTDASSAATMNLETAGASGVANSAVSRAAIVAALSGAGSNAVLIDWPMPLATAPVLDVDGNALASGDIYLTSGTHASPSAVGTYNGATWDYTAADGDLTYSYQGAIGSYFFTFTGGSWYFSHLNSAGDAGAVHLHGIEQDSADLPTGSMVVWEVYAVSGAGATQFAGLTDVLCWFDSDGATPLNSTTEGLLTALTADVVYVAHDTTNGPIKTTVWTGALFAPMSAGFYLSVSALNPVNPGGVNVTVSGTIADYPLSDPDGDEDVATMWILGGTGMATSITASTGVRLNGDTGAGTDTDWTKAATASRAWAFTIAGNVGTYTGHIEIQGKLIPFSAEISA